MNVNYFKLIKLNLMFVFDWRGRRGGADEYSQSNDDEWFSIVPLLSLYRPSLNI